ncbi:MAG: U32 family peptidase [Verrucomicrobiales bacterium]|nr:U32 family peptidase [Verrucomicrobiales bacterium]
MPILPELLSPAGNWDCARAAVANGADAIYFGLPRFNARMRADNFTMEDLPELMTFLHEHGVKGYTAFNILVFSSELEAAAEALRGLERAGVDAVIVQDLGLASLVKQVAPGLRLHASTQMTLTSPEGLAFARRLGIDQAVLARELSLRELERFRAEEDPGLPLEVFVHGALCVAYSGQCLTSESLGRRSANRGECAQACRMPYEMVVDGVTRDLGDRRYLLSPQDLAAVEEIPRLIELGIRSFKIEGRLKTPEYVAAVTRVYRQAIDAALAGESSAVPPEAWYELEMTFSRGLFSGWLHGVNHQELVGARYGKKRGARIGRVTRVGRDAVELEALAVEVKPGDGVVFENPEDTNAEQGGRVYAVKGRWLEFQRGKLDGTALRPGTGVYKTDDPALNRRLQQTYQGALPVRKQWDVAMSVTGAVGEPMRITARAVHRRHGQVVEGEVESASALEAARNRPLDGARLREQLGRLGGTPLELAELKVDLTGELILPVSELNRLRRALVARLLGVAERDAAREGGARENFVVPKRLGESDTSPESETELTVLCRDETQVQAALAAGIRRIYLDFEDIRRYADLVRQVRDFGGQSTVWLATPRIQKSGEAGFFKLIERAEPDGVLVRNLGALAFFEGSGLPVTGDFSLNVANHLTAALLKKETALQRLTISYDLNLEQVLDLLAAAPAQWFELTLHQHMPMFHMEHCAFAAFLSQGTDFTNCGRPCERHRVALRDRIGVEHPLKADVGCRNTLFNAVAQTGAAYYEALHGAGLRQFRVELLEEDASESSRILKAYQEVLAGRRQGESLRRELHVQARLGVTDGTLQG